MTIARTRTRLVATLEAAIMASAVIGPAAHAEVPGTEGSEPQVLSDAPTPSSTSTSRPFPLGSPTAPG